jgi:acyl-CoA hydrolase
MLTTRHGERWFVPGAAGEPRGVTPALFGAAGLEITTSFVPGLNPLNADSIGPDSCVTGLFMQPALAHAQRAGRFRHLPMSYAAMLKHIETGPRFDACLVQVAPPDASGRCSLGPAAEFTPAVMARSDRIVAVVNPHVPAIRNAPYLMLEQVAERIDSDVPLVTYEMGDIDPATIAIARHVATLIRDGATLQVGLGKVPHALMAALCDRQRLKIHSGMISDGIMTLDAAGALAKNHTHCTTAVLGSRTLYDWVAEREDVHVCGVGHIHLPAVLAAIDGLVAINSALEVDLFGQCNLEHARGSAVSGGGGASDFARGARLGHNGVSIVALPASFGSQGSRICAQLSEKAVATLPRSDVDIVVTEYGIADLRRKSVHERAEALTGVAAPTHRPGLTDQWAAIIAKL